MNEHTAENDAGRWVVFKRPKPQAHGASRYAHGDCRCDVCTRANTDRQRRYRESKRASVIPPGEDRP